MKKLLLGLLLALGIVVPAKADSLVTTTCGTLREAYTAGSTRLDTVNTNGETCISGTINATVSVTFPFAGTVGAAVPASADYTGLNVGGTLRGATGSNPIGTVYSQQVDLAAVAGSPVATGHGTAAGAIRVELPTDGTGLVLAAQSGSYNVVCTAGCSSSTPTSIGTPGQAVPASAQYIGINTGGNIVGWTGAVTQGTSPWVVAGTVTNAQGTSPWVVAGSVTATQGTSPWVISGSVSPTGAPLVTQGTSPWVVAGTVTAVQSGSYNVVCTSGCTAGSATTAGTPGQSVPVSADYMGVNVAGTIRGATATNPIGTVYAQQMDLAAVSGSPVVTGHGTAAGAIRVELPTDGTGVVLASQNTSPWVVAGTVTSTQGTSPWVVSGSVSPTGAPLVTQGTSPWVVAGTVTSTQGTSPWVVSGSVSPTGAPLVTQGTSPWVVSGTVTAAQTGTWNVVCTSGCSASSSTTAGTPGQMVPASADYIGINVAGNIRAPTGTNPVGSVYAQQIDLSAVSGASVATGHGTAAGTIRVELPTDGTGLVNVYPNTPGAWGLGATAAAVPTSAAYVGLSDGTNLRGWLNAANSLNSTGAGIGTAQIVGQCDDTSPTALTENQFGNARIDCTDHTQVVGGLTTTNAPTYTTATARGLSLTTAGGLRVDLKDTASNTNNLNFNLATIGGSSVTGAGAAGTAATGGGSGTNTALTTNPMNLGAQAVSSENTAVTTARQVQLVADLVGKLIVLPYANPENFVSGVVSSSMTAATSFSILAAPASGLRNYITGCTFSNAHATVGTDIYIQDGVSGNVLWTIPAAAAYGGAHITFPTPLRQPTTATAIYVQNVTTGASTRASCNGYKGA